MGGELVIAVVVFLASAAAVWVLGAGLSKYGDALADLTGLGRLFVGSILVALATSLPELSTNISAVRLNPPNPDLAWATCSAPICWTCSSLLWSPCYSAGSVS